MSVATGTATTWLERWDRQQEFYMADREERFTVIADAVEAGTDCPAPTIVDLGCGPGSLAVRLLDRMPEATVVAVDADPLLLGLGRAAYGERPGLRFVDADLTTPGWAETLGVDGPVDAVVSTTALHWLSHVELASVYATAGRLLRPGGVFVNGDHMHASDDQPALDELQRGIRHRRAERAGRIGDGEDWHAWWNGVTADAELAPLVTARSDRAVFHHGEGESRYPDHLEALRAAGFREAGTVWQFGDDRVLVAIR